LANSCHRPVTKKSWEFFDQKPHEALAIIAIEIPSSPPQHIPKVHTKLVDQNSARLTKGLESLEEATALALCRSHRRDSVLDIYYHKVRNDVRTKCPDRYESRAHDMP